MPKKEVMGSLLHHNTTKVFLVSKIYFIGRYLLGFAYIPDVQGGLRSIHTIRIHQETDQQLYAGQNDIWRLSEPKLTDAL